MKSWSWHMGHTGTRLKVTPLLVVGQCLNPALSEDKRNLFPPLFLKVLFSHPCSPQPSTSTQGGKLHTPSVLPSYGAALTSPGWARCSLQWICHWRSPNRLLFHMSATARPYFPDSPAEGGAMNCILANGTCRKWWASPLGLDLKTLGTTLHAPSYLLSVSQIQGIQRKISRPKGMTQPLNRRILNPWLSPIMTLPI